MNRRTPLITELCLALIPVFMLHSQAACSHAYNAHFLSVPTFPIEDIWQRNIHTTCRRILSRCLRAFAVLLKGYLQERKQRLKKKSPFRTSGVLEWQCDTCGTLTDLMQLLTAKLQLVVTPWLKWIKRNVKHNMQRHQIKHTASLLNHMPGKATHDHQLTATRPKKSHSES